MQQLFSGTRGYKLYALRRRIVERLERENERAGKPECWRMVGPVVQVGREVGQHREWRTVPVLSVELLSRYRARKEAESFPDIPF